MRYQLLEWDSKFFGFSVACINNHNLNFEELSDVLLDLKSESIELVYFSSPHLLNIRLVEKFGGVLTDIKTTFVIDFKNIKKNELLPKATILPYNKSMSYQVMESLAIQSGVYSRFSVDEKVSKIKFESLFKTWMIRSINKEIAEEVLVATENKMIVGMVTLTNNGGRGDIGLLSVEKEYRGRNYGEILVRAAQSWFIARGYKSGQVVTQGANVKACNLYKKCDYISASEEYFYHFWLTP